MVDLLAQEWKAADGHDVLRLRFELGRFVSAFCGYCAAEVVDIKEAGERTFAVVRGGTHHFRTPYAQGRSHPFRVLPVEDWQRAVAADPHTKLKADVATFLGKKGHITPRAAGDGFDITQRGRESLADIDATGG